MKRSYTHDDLPVLRSVRDATRRMLDAANKLKADESDIGMLIAYCSVIDYLQAEFDRVGRVLDRLEKTTAQGEAQRAGAGCRDGIPAMKGQGCPALPFAGSASRTSICAGDAIPAGGDITPLDNPLLAGLDNRRLTPSDNPLHTHKTHAGEPA
jgi:hypothetical protein